VAKDESFEAFMVEREAAALAYTKGEGRAVDALTSRVDPVSFFGPDGGRVESSEAVRKSFAAGAANFSPESDSRLEIIDMGGDGEIGFWTGIQHAKLKMKGRDDIVPMQLRITEVFRRQDGGWKLVHRHADMLKQG